MKYSIYWFKDHMSEPEFFMDCDRYVFIGNIVELYVRGQVVAILNMVLFAYLKSI